MPVHPAAPGKGPVLTAPAMPTIRAGQQVAVPPGLGSTRGESQQGWVGWGLSTGPGLQLHPVQLSPLLRTVMLLWFGFTLGQPRGVPAQYIPSHPPAPSPCQAHWSSTDHSSKMLVLVGLMLYLAPADALTAFPPKFQVGELNGDVVVRCNTSVQQVTWMQNGEPDPMVELVTEGQNLTIIGLDLPATGNYSCWANTILLDSTYVVVSSTPLPGKEGINVSCQAESYHGSFRCSWTGPHSAVFHARLTRSDGSLGEWVPATGHHGQFSASFVDPSFCPFGEELHPLQLQLEGLSDTSYLNFSIHFFIRDIVRPDPPQKLTVQRQGEQLHLAWAPPASWLLPKSYFTLFYRLQYELPNGTQVDKDVEDAEETWLQVCTRRVRISCQDPYASHAWSPWSPWQDIDGAQQCQLQAH